MASYIANKFIENNTQVNFGIGLGGGSGVNSISSSFISGSPNFLGQTSQSSTVNQSSTFNPNIYYDLLRNYPFLQTLVNILKAPIEEAIDQITDQIKVTPNKDTSDQVKDASIIVNNFFNKCNFKNFIKNNLDNFILRGSFISFIDYRGGKLIDLMNSFDYRLIHNGINFTWINPIDHEYNVNLQNNINGLPNITMTSDQFNKQEGFSYVYFTEYHYKLETVNKISRKQLNNMNEKEIKENLIKILENKIELKTAKKLNDYEKEKLDKILVLYTEQRPKSLFEPFLKKLFTLSIKELVFDLLSLLQYLKSDIVTVNIRPQNNSNERENQKELKIIKDIKALLNKNNIEMIRSSEDPSGLLNIVYEKLFNRVEVLPSVDEFTDIQMLNIPDIEQRLSTLYQDILENKRFLADEIGISQESISGNSNRWEAISRNEKMALTIMNIKSTIELFVCQTACNIFCQHVNESYWNKRLNNIAYPTKFNFGNKKYELTTSNNGLNKTLVNFSEKKEQPEEGELVIIKLLPHQFIFKLNLSTILDSYASKSKEIIISENFQSVSNVIESIKNFVANSDLLSEKGSIEYILNNLKISENLINLIDKEKLENIFKQTEENPEGMGEEQMMMEGEEGVDDMNMMMEEGGVV